MLLHKTVRYGRARTRRRRSAKLHKRMPVTVNVHVFIADTAPLPSRGVVPSLSQAPFADSQRDKQEILWHSFREHVEQWKNETQHWSSMPRITSHPSYLRIIGLAGEFGKKALEKLILQELEADPYHWFDALEAISGKNPVKPDDDFDAAVNAWLEWGRQEGII